MDRVMVLKGFREYAPLPVVEPQIDDDRTDEEIKLLMEGFEEL